MYVHCPRKVEPSKTAASMPQYIILINTFSVLSPLFFGDDTSLCGGSGEGVVTRCVTTPVNFRLTERIFFVRILGEGRV